MSKVILLDFAEEGEMKATVPDDMICIFVDNSSGEPVFKGKLPDGNFVVFDEDRG